MRAQNWPHALAEYVRARHAKPFSWGTHDCAQFAAGAVQAMTGTRPAFPRYQTERAARALIAAKPLRDRVTEILGPEIPVPMAQRGDVVLILDAEQGPSLGICFGEQSLFLGKPAGTRSLPTVNCECAWRVE